MVEYNFYNPTRLLFGEGKIAKIGTILEECGYKKILLIFGGGSIKENGVYADDVWNIFERQEKIRQMLKKFFIWHIKEQLRG